MSIDQELRLMFRQRADEVRAAPVVPDRTVRRVRMRKALWTGSAIVFAAVAVVGGALALRNVVSTDAAPVPPADRKVRELPSPPEHLQGELVATGLHDGAPWWITARFDKAGALCVGVTLEGGVGGEGCGVGSETGSPGEPIGVNTFSGYAPLAPTVYYGEVRSDILALDFKAEDVTDRIETLPAPPGSDFDLRFYIYFGGQVDEIVGFNAAGETVAEVVDHPSLMAPGFGHQIEEVVASGTRAGSDWTLTAAQASDDLCYTFDTEDGGGGGCATEPGPAWRGDVNQSAESKHPDVAPVWGAIPLRTDDVRVLLGDGSEVPAVIFRPEGHNYAYYITWIPDAFAAGEVAFRIGSESTTEPLCASRAPGGGRGKGNRHGLTCASSAVHR
jgi:hypothetical protein